MNIGVIFDCDGTLIDSMGEWHAVDERLAERAGIELTQADRDYMTAATLEESSAYIHEHFHLGDSAEDVMQMIFDDIEDFYRSEAKPKPGAMDFVRGLYEAGVPMGVASSTPPYLLHIAMQSCGFAPYMKTILSVDDVHSSKREPVIYNAVREVLGTELSCTWGVEDALYAVQTLEKAGYKTLAVYDSEIAGSPSALENAADCCIMSFEDITAGKFLELAKRAANGEV